MPNLGSVIEKDKLKTKSLHISMLATKVGTYDTYLPGSEKISSLVKEQIMRRKREKQNDDHRVGIVATPLKYRMETATLYYNW